ncbi:hypothetical protein ACJBU6_10586 [Exserohilum turcicum]
MIDYPKPTNNSRADGYGYNPRCVTRDISNYLTSRYTRTPQIAALILNHTTIGDFQDTMQLRTGVHGAGHFTVSGDPGSDFYTSPGGMWNASPIVTRISADKLCYRRAFLLSSCHDRSGVFDLAVSRFPTQTAGHCGWHAYVRRRQQQHAPDLGRRGRSGGVERGWQEVQDQGVGQYSSRAFLLPLSIRRPHNRSARLDYDMKKV